MKEEDLAGKALEILNSIQAAAGKVAEQLPEVAQQYLLFARVNVTITLLLIAAVMVALIIWARKACDHYENHGPLLLAAAIDLILLMPFCVNLEKFFFVWLAPKAYLLQEVSHLIK